MPGRPHEPRRVELREHRLVKRPLPGDDLAGGVAKKALEIRLARPGRADDLRRIRSADLRKRAVRLAGGRTWVKQAAFLCIMTAVSDRVFWKYSSSDAYRLFLLDAGHLAQTFALLATAHGLGPFTTAAMSEDAIEELLGLDGVREFPVYLCGAGVPLSSAH